MNREQALSYLNMSYSELATEANWSESAKLVAYSFAIDQALRTLGIGEDAIATYDVPGSRVTAYFAALDYFALLRYSTTFAMRADVSVSGAISASQSQVFRQVRQMLGTAEERLTSLGLSPTAQVTIGRLNLDIYEPGLTLGGMG